MKSLGSLLVSTGIVITVTFGLLVPLDEAAAQQSRTGDELSTFGQSFLTTDGPRKTKSFPTLVCLVPFPPGYNPFDPGSSEIECSCEGGVSKNGLPVEGVNVRWHREVFVHDPEGKPVSVADARGNLLTGSTGLFTFGLNTVIIAQDPSGNDTP